DDSKDGIEVDVDDKTLDEYCLTYIHRRKLIYIKNSNDVSYRDVSPNIITIAGLFKDYQVYANDVSPLIYFTTKVVKYFAGCIAYYSEGCERLWVLNTNTMQISSLNIIVGWLSSVYWICKVREGKIFLGGYKENLEENRRSMLCSRLTPLQW
ncbi:hypothetical protein PFISCL1PPCAC_17240, partial [Pristionchus fissidentatus]